MAVPLGEAIYLRHRSREIPLTRAAKPADPASAGDLALLKQASASELFPAARDSSSSLAGLFLLIGDWEGSHQVAQTVSSREGAYWHAILHRIEPDPSNAAYWYRQVGTHPIADQLLQEVRGVITRKPISGWTLPSAWNPRRFIEWCEEARALPGSPQEAAALAIQRREFDLLFTWCAAPA